MQYIMHLAIDCIHDNAHFGAHALSYSGTSARRGQPLYKTQLIINDHFP